MRGPRKYVRVWRATARGAHLRALRRHKREQAKVEVGEAVLGREDEVAGVRVRVHDARLQQLAQ